MIISFADHKLEKQCNSSKELRRHYGDVCGKLIEKRLHEIEAALSLDVLKRLPQVRCHELGHDRKGQLAVDVKHPYRLIFKPNHDPVPLKSDGGLDWTSVTGVTIIEIVDYHAQ